MEETYFITLSAPFAERRTMGMKKGDIFEGSVERLDFPNRGVLHVDGQPVIVKNALPGQRIRFVVSKKRHGRLEGRLLEVLSPASGERQEGVCRHFGSCGGCLYQGLAYEEQLKIKEQQVKGMLDGVCDPASYEFQGIKGSPLPDAYRNKMEFSFGDEYKGGPLALGMHRRGSFYDIVTTSGCQIVHSDFCKILETTLAYFSEHGVGYYKKLQHVGYLRHLLVRRAVKTGEILAALVTSTQVETLPGAGVSMEDKIAREQEMLAGWCAGLRALDVEGRFAGILHIKNDSLSDVVQSDGTEILYGQDFFYEELLGLRFCITPFSFFQTNSLGAEVLYDIVRDYVGEAKDKVVFDLYSGTGTIAQVLAPVAARVVGVEIVEEAVEAARGNAAANGLDNCIFISGDVLIVLENLAEKPDIIILDPPRDGIHPKALEKIGAHIRAKKIIYISCKPTSLVRDLIELQNYGYRVGRVCCVDMFPGTGHVECVALMSRVEK